MLEISASAGDFVERQGAVKGLSRNLPAAVILFLHSKKSTLSENPLLP